MQCMEYISGGGMRQSLFSCRLNQVPEKMQLFITRYFDSDYLNGTQCFGSALVQVMIRIKGLLS